MYYFASDMHLGSGSAEESRQREQWVVAWLDSVAPTAKAIFLVGDVFDFWYEYKRVVPQGFTRLLGKFSELTDRGVEIHLFVGNHDMWQRGYLERECGVKVHYQREEMELYGKRVSICHGDDIYARYLGGGARFINATFRSRVARWLFSHLIHPDFALRFGQGWSGDSRKSKEIAMPFLGKEDPLVKEAEKINGSKRVDYFIFGHNHCAERYGLEAGGEAIFLGHWFEGPIYASLDEQGVIQLHK
jgi:UDP-2,3-diacylglucosamine hydrolase